MVLEPLENFGEQIRKVLVMYTDREAESSREKRKRKNTSRSALHTKTANGSGG